MRKGEQTKREILEATLRVMVTDGVHHTTFRAVAEEAAVKPSLVGYHFPDRGELLRSAAAMLFARQGALINDIFQEIFTQIDRFGLRNFKRSIPRAELSLALTDSFTDFIYNYYLSDRTDPRALLTLKFDIHPDPALIHVRSLGHRSLKAYLIEMATKLQSKNPREDARLLAGAITLFELETLKQSRPDHRKIHAAIWHCLSHILKVSGRLEEASARVAKSQRQTYKRFTEQGDLFG